LLVGSLNNDAVPGTPLALPIPPDREQTDETAMVAALADDKPAPARRLPKVQAESAKAKDDCSATSTPCAPTDPGHAASQLTSTL